MGKNLTEREEEENKKTYVSFYCFRISAGLLCTYVYISISMILSVVNRIIFINYKFNFNLTFLLMQQITTLIIFTVIGTKNQTFIKKTGKISFDDFYKHKYRYLSFSLIFSLHHMVNFKAKQLTQNVNMYMSLRKLIPVLILIFDYFFESKKPKISSIISAPCVTLGTILVGIDGVSKDLLGCLVGAISLFFTIAMNKYSEKFPKKTKVSNLKLLVYNSYISNLVLICAIIVSKEYKGYYQYYKMFTLNDNEREKIGIEGGLKELCFYLILSCVFCVVLNSTHFISNEKNSSLITDLLNRSKEIMITVFFYFYDRKRNNLTIKMIIGTTISIVGAFIVIFDSAINNFIFGIDKKNINNTKNINDTKKGEEKEIQELRELEEKMIDKK